MTTHYYVESKVSGRWFLLKTETRQTDALHYVKENPATKYPIRIVKVTRKVVFEDRLK
jgi:hypothetical protein